MNPTTKNQVLAVLGFEQKNIPTLIKELKERFGVAPHYYTMRRLLDDLIAEGKACVQSLPYGVRQTKYYRLTD